MVLHAMGSPELGDVLAGYRTARAQQALFDPAGRTTTHYDEFVDDAGAVRPAWRELAEEVGERGREGLDRLQGAVRGLVDNDGITYLAGEGADGPVPWLLDGLPLLVSASDWDRLESGVLQRSRILDAVLADLYGPRRSITSGVLPPQLLFAHPGYLRAARGIALPGRRQLFMHGCDVSRGADGDFRVNADWTQAPSGAGYALADRRVVAHAMPDLYERVGPRPVSPWAQALRLALLDAAPEAADEPVVVVLSPGTMSETAFDQAYLAGALGFPLVESSDLVVRGGRLWMRSLGMLRRVDVVLRRVDAEYADPLELRADSRLGVVGLVEVLRRGAVTVVNTLGSGILESPGVMHFLPELARLLLDEIPLLPAATTYWAGADLDRAHLLTHLSSLLIRPVTGGEAIVGPTLTATARAALAARIEAAPWQWIGQELPQFSSAPSDQRRGGLSAAGVGMRLFTVAQTGGYAPMVGGLGYLLAQGHRAAQLETAAGKDIWVRPPARAQAEPTPVALPSVTVTGSPTKAVSSPRVLSDLFWMGRYAERAEHMARLLTVTRERYHEFRRRQDSPGSDCVPVLLTAVGQITGTDTGADGDHAEMIATAPTTLWALTADRHRPGSLAQAVERLGLSARSVRDQMSGDTWMVLTTVERAVLRSSTAPPESRTEGEAYLAAAHSLTLAGMLALAGVAAESMVQDVGWTMMDIGKRIERGQALTALLRATLDRARPPAAEQTITESALAVCESAISYRRRTLGNVSVAAVADLVLFDAQNPRSLAFQFERLRTGLRTLPGTSGTSRPERLVEDLTVRLRRVDPTDLEDVAPDGRRDALAGLLTRIDHDLRELSTAITASHLALPGDMQPLWGPDQRRVLP